MDIKLSKKMFYELNRLIKQPQTDRIKIKIIELKSYISQLKHLELIIEEKEDEILELRHIIKSNNDLYNEAPFKDYEDEEYY